MKKSLSQVLILSAALLLASCVGGNQDSSAAPGTSEAGTSIASEGGTSEAGTSAAGTSAAGTSAAGTSSSRPSGTSTPTSTPVASSSTQAEGTVAFSGIDIIEEGGKAYAKLTGSISGFSSAAAMKMAFGLVSGENYIMGSATPADADYKYVPTVDATAGTFELKVDLSTATLAQGDYTAMCGPKGHYAAVGGQQATGMTYGTGKAVANGFRFSVRSHNGAIALDELPPIAMTISRVEVEGDKVYHIVGGQLNTAKMPQATFEALTPLMVYETTVASWHQYKSNTSGAELTTTVSVDAQGNALIKTDVTSLPNDRYNVKVNLDNTVTQYADTQMDVVIDTSANPVIFGAHEYVCYADSSHSGDKAYIYGNCGLIITSHISYQAGTPFGDVTPWSDPNATPSTYYEMYPNTTNTSGLGSDKKMNSGKVSIFDITGLPAGEYEVYVQAKTDNPSAVGFSTGVQMDDNGSAEGGNPVPGRYYVQAGTDEKVYTDTGTKLYSEVGLNASSMEWTTEAVVKSVMIADGTTSFKFGHTNSGYSIKLEAIRLIRIGNWMKAPTVLSFDEQGEAKVEAEDFAIKHTIFTNTGEETDYTTDGTTYPASLNGTVEDDAEASGGKYVHGLFREGWNNDKRSNMSGEVVYRIKLTEDTKFTVKAKIKSNMTTEKVCLDLKVDGASKGTLRSADTWVEVESAQIELTAGVHTISFVGQQLGQSEQYQSVIADIDYFKIAAIAVPQATLKANYTGAPADTTVKATDDGKVPELPVITRAGDYKFLGWFTEAEGGTKVEAGADLTADMDLYAHWLEYTWTAGTKVNAVTPYETVYGDKAYAMMKADATGDNDPSKKLAKNTDLFSTYNITDAIPAGTYDLEFYGKTDSNTGYSFATRYVVYLGEDVQANYIQPNAGNYSDYGWSSSGDKYTNKAVMTVTIPEGATSITVKYVGTGYSCFINGMRLVQRTANTTPIA